MLSAAQYAGMAICASVPLNRLMQDMEMFKRLMETQKQHTVLLSLIPNYQFARNMSLSTDHPLLLDGELMSETEFMATARATGNAPLIAFLLTMKVQLSSYFHDYMAGQQHAWALLRSDLSSLSPGTEANYLLRAGLVLAAIPQRRRATGKAKKLLAQLQVIATRSPGVGRNKATLLEAWIKSTEGDHDMALFDQSIHGAGEELLWNEQGLACELAASACESIDRPKSLGYLEKAAVAYEKWEASTKVKHVLRRLGTASASTHILPPQERQ